MLAGTVIEEAALLLSMPAQGGNPYDPIFLLFCLQIHAASATNAAPKAPLPFDHPEWIFELKYDGFRALTVIRDGGAQLISRNGHPFASFADLGKQIAAALPGVTDTVLDGEIVCVDASGRPQFERSSS
jgi:ATP-dependent DNA ligase